VFRRAGEVIREMGGGGGGAGAAATAAAAAPPPAKNPPTFLPSITDLLSFLSPTPSTPPQVLCVLLLPGPLRAAAAEAEAEGGEEEEEEEEGGGGGGDGGLAPYMLEVRAHKSEGRGGRRGGERQVGQQKR